MPAALRSDRLHDARVAHHSADRRSLRTNTMLGVRAVEVVGLLALASSALYFVSDGIEVVQGRFSTGQLWLTLVAEATVPIFVIGFVVRATSADRTARRGERDRLRVQLRVLHRHGGVRAGQRNEGLRTARCGA
jgi:hypothetical protein